MIDEIDVAVIIGVVELVRVGVVELVRVGVVEQVLRVIGVGRAGIKSNRSGRAGINRSG